MCGIAGIFHYGTSAGDVDPHTLQRMASTLAHRGPDGDGVWISTNRRMGLGHRRLAIVEPGPSAAQPLANEDGTVWVTFNGEIYNHVALRRRLVECGHRFRTDHADTEVIVHAYEEWGPSCVDRFDGEFAFAVVDDRRGRLLLARDRLGVKPLYISLRPGLLLFASEIKALLQHPAVTPAMSGAALYHYLTFMTTPAPMTMFEDIFKVPAGCLLEANQAGAIAATRYWNPLPPLRRRHAELDGLSAAAQEDFCVRGIRERLDAAVAARMMSDVPFGVLLSGGLDSSGTVGLLARHMSAPVRTFTVGYRDHVRTNEFDEARGVAALFKTEHHEIQIDERDALEFLPALSAQQDEPLPDWVCIPLSFVSRLARDTGTPVVQVGEGSDEEFCGYSHYMRYLDLHRLNQRFGRLPSALQQSVAAMADAGAAMTGRGGFYADAIERAASDRELFWGGAIAFWERDKRALVRRERVERAGSTIPEALRSIMPSSFLRPDSFAVVDAYRAEIDAAFPDADVFTRMTYLECKVRLPELLLLRADRITMSASIEARVPFLDHRLVEFVMGVPAALKIKNGVPKFLLKKALEGVLPASVIHRPKVGFNAPMAEWLRGRFGEQVRSTMMSTRLRQEGWLNDHEIERLWSRHRAGHDVSLQIWTLYTVSAWFDRWIAGSSAA